MDPKLLLVKMCTLLYKESVSSDKSRSSVEIVKQVIDTIKFPETGMDFDSTRETLQALRATVKWMCENPRDHIYDRGSLLQRIRLNASEDEILYLAFEQGIDGVVDGDELTVQISNGHMELRDYLTDIQVKEIIKKAYQRAHFNNSGSTTIGPRAIAREISALLEPFTAAGEDEHIDGLVYSFDITDDQKMFDMLDRAAAETSAEGILKMGWQGLNRMTGDHCGFRRGETIVVGALQHNFKTGATMNMFKHAALYNKPWMRDPKKKPCLVHISTENDPHINMMWLYQNLMENETGVECDLSPFKDPDPEIRTAAIKAAANYVKEQMTVNGYHIKMYRFDPSTTTFYSITDALDKLHQQGYEVHMLVLDYLNMCSKAGCVTNGPMGSEIRDLFRRVRNYTAPRGITFISPHQLSTEAKALVRNGVEDFVKEIANKGYYDGCKTLDQEVDMEIYIHIEKHDGKSWLTLQRGKHRKSGVLTKDKDLYCAIPFHDAGGIKDDVNGADQSRRNIRGGDIGSGSEQPWWATGPANVTTVGSSTTQVGGDAANQDPYAIEDGGLPQAA